MTQLPRTIPWLVHLLTSCGALLGFFSLIALEERNIHLAALLSLGALSIDSLDGTFARWADVQNRLPNFDGRRLDDIVDYLNYVIVPAYFLVITNSLPHPGWACLPILASAYGFSHREAKTPDNFFRGFPSLWNVLAIYIWWYEAAHWLAVLIIVTCSISVFLPLKFIYPSKTRRFQRTTCAFGTVWILSVAGAICIKEESTARTLMLASLSYPAYYLAVSAWLGSWFLRK